MCVHLKAYNQYFLWQFIEIIESILEQIFGPFSKKGIKTIQNWMICKDSKEEKIETGFVWKKRSNSTFFF